MRCEHEMYWGPEERAAFDMFGLCVVCMEIEEARLSAPPKHLEIHVTSTGRVIRYTIPKQPRTFRRGRRR